MKRRSNNREGAALKVLALIFLVAANVFLVWTARSLGEAGAISIGDGLVTANTSGDLFIGTSGSLTVTGGFALTASNMDLNGQTLNGLATMNGEAGSNQTFQVPANVIFALQDDPLGVNFLLYNTTNGDLLMRAGAAGDFVRISDGNNTARFEIKDDGTNVITMVGSTHINGVLTSRRWTYSPVAGHALGVADTEIDPGDTNGTVELVGDAGGNTIATILSTGFAEGAYLEITVGNLAGGITLTDTASPGADQMALSGNAVLTADSVVVVRFNGTYWQEVSRALN